MPPPLHPHPKPATRRSPRAAFTSVFSALILAVSAGCLTLDSGRDESRKAFRPWTTPEIQMLEARAKNPQRMWVTLVPSDQGMLFENANRIHIGQSTVLPMQSKMDDTLPLVRTEGLHGDGIPTLLDTSSQDVWVTPDTASELACVPVGPPLFEQRAFHLEHDVPGYVVIAPRFKLDTLAMESVVMMLHAAHGSLGPLARDPEFVQARVVVGYPLMRQFAYIQFDYPGGKVIAGSSDPYQALPIKRLATAPIREVRGALATDGSVDGEESLVVIDSAGDFELVLPDGAERRVSQLVLGNLVFRQVQAGPGEHMQIDGPGFPGSGAASWNATG